MYTFVYFFNKLLFIILFLISLSKIWGKSMELLPILKSDWRVILIGFSEFNTNNISRSIL